MSTVEKGAETAGAVSNLVKGGPIVGSAAIVAQATGKHFAVRADRKAKLQDGAPRDALAEEAREKTKRTRMRWGVGALSVAVLAGGGYLGVRAIVDSMKPKQLTAAQLEGRVNSVKLKTEQIIVESDVQSGIGGKTANSVWGHDIPGTGGSTTITEIGALQGIADYRVQGFHFGIAGANGRFNMTAYMPISGVHSQFVERAALLNADDNFLTRVGGVVKGSNIPDRLQNGHKLAIDEAEAGCGEAIYGVTDPKTGLSVIDAGIVNTLRNQLQLAEQAAATVDPNSEATKELRMIAGMPISVQYIKPVDSGDNAGSTRFGPASLKDINFGLPVAPDTAAVAKAFHSSVEDTTVANAGCAPTPTAMQDIMNIVEGNASQAG